VPEKETYEDYILNAAEIRRDLDEVIHPMMRGLKKAFSILFQEANLRGGDFKRLSDMKYYQGGWPSPNTPPRESNLASQVAALIKLENLAGTETFAKFLSQEGIKVSVESTVGDNIQLNRDEAEDLEKALSSAGLNHTMCFEGTSATRSKILPILIEKAQHLQKEICEQSDLITVDAAEHVESAFKIKKGNFIKAVNLMATKLRKGEGPMAEKIDDINDAMDNLSSAIEPLTKKSG